MLLLLLLALLLLLLLCASCSKRAGFWHNGNFHRLSSNIRRIFLPSGVLTSPPYVGFLLDPTANLTLKPALTRTARDSSGCVSWSMTRASPCMKILYGLPPVVVTTNSTSARSASIVSPVAPCSWHLEPLPRGPRIPQTCTIAPLSSTAAVSFLGTKR